MHVTGPEEYYNEAGFVFLSKLELACLDLRATRTA